MPVLRVEAVPSSVVRPADRGRSLTEGSPRSFENEGRGGCRYSALKRWKRARSRASRLTPCGDADVLGIRARGTACPSARFRSSRNASRSTPAGFVCDPRGAWRLHPGDCRWCRRHRQDRRRTLVGPRTSASLSPFASLLGIAGRQRQAHVTRRCSSAAVLASAARLVQAGRRRPSSTRRLRRAGPATRAPGRRGPRLEAADLVADRAT